MAMGILELESLIGGGDLYVALWDYFAARLNRGLNCGEIVS